MYGTRSDGSGGRGRGPGWAHTLQLMKCELLAAAPGSTVDETGLIVIAVLLCAALGYMFLAYRRELAGREAAQRRAALVEQALAARGPSAEDQAEQAASQRNQVMFDQHKRINQLTIDKLEAEIQLMQAQLATRVNQKDREEAGKEAHELMVEKTRLEIDSLRLHIAEMRKRMEDWNTD